MELLFEGNEETIKFTPRKLLGLRRFNWFVEQVYIQSWFSSRSIVDAPVNDIDLYHRLCVYSDPQIRNTGIKMFKRHSWYLSPEMATLVLFSKSISDTIKTQLVTNICNDRGPHLMNSQSLPTEVKQLKISKTLFQTCGLDDSFLEQLISIWSDNYSWQLAAEFAHNLPSINDLAERGVALIQEFNASTRNEEQRQYLLQVIEEHRKNFSIVKINRDVLERLCIVFAVAQVYLNFGW